MNASLKLVETNSPGLTSIRYISEDMHRLITHMIQLTQAADVFHSSPEDRRTIQTVLTMGRNQVQHRLLSYPTSQYSMAAFAVDETNLADPDRTLALTELIRLSAMIYASMTTFPLPWSAGVKERLAERFRSVWLTSQMHRQAQNPEFTTAHAELKAWLLWFGCFAAFRSPQRRWFERELRGTLQAFYGARWEIVTFEEVK